MKIGEFAKLFDVKKSQVRFYVDRHMLVPIINGTYPEYDETCVDDMTFILKHRSYGFSIDEISKLLLYKRYSQEEDLAYKATITGLLEKKLMAFDQEIEILKQKKKEVSDELLEINNTTDLSIIHGIKVSNIDKLSCHKCHQHYEVENAYIKENYLVSGRLKCTCSELSLQDGIVYAEDYDPENPFEISMKLDANIKNEYYAEIKKAGKHMTELVNIWDHKQGILFFNAVVEIVTTGLDKCLSKEGWYIFANYNLKRLNKIREYIIHQDYADRCIFIHYTSDYPLENLCRYFIDYGGYASDLGHRKDVWSIKEMEHVFERASSGLYLDYGYYHTSEDYLQVYDKYFNSKVIYKKDMMSYQVLDKDIGQEIKLQLIEFTR